MAVGGIGMVCTANYDARKFGIRAAMPGFIARRLCPELVFVKPDFQKYTKASQATRAIFRDFDPDFEAGSLDEAYLDITAYCQQHDMTGTVTAYNANSMQTPCDEILQAGMAWSGIQRHWSPCMHHVMSHGRQGWLDEAVTADCMKPVLDNTSPRP